jgi:hypothetical protein
LHTGDTLRRDQIVVVVIALGRIVGIAVARVDAALNTQASTRSREFLRGVVFDKRLEYQDITTCQDINGNGSDELVFLGRRASDASLNVIVKDSGTGEQIAFLRF